VSTLKSNWTNASVQALAGERDPVAAVIEKAREVVVRALDNGWSGPPFDPITLATDHLKLKIVATDAVREARTVPDGSVGRIEYNPNRPRERRRYSIAHEIAHTLFPDYAKRVRHRGSNHGEQAEADDWQLEALCNIGAAEILMPVGTLPPVDRATLTVDWLSSLRPKYDVSMEAVLIRAVRMANFPCAAFTAAHIDDAPKKGRYRVEYVISSGAWQPPARARSVLPEGTIVSECTAVNHMAKADEHWGSHPVHVECVGIPPSPWSVFPRVAGVVMPAATDVASADENARVNIVVGNALAPMGHGPKVLVHVVNDATPNWGGNGFAAALKRQWRDVQGDFQEWGSSRQNLRLGSVRFFRKSSTLTIASMIAQKGYGDTLGVRRLRYNALERCLEEVATYAKEHDASVHMPRIGAGQGGASWGVVCELITGAICSKGIPVTVYDLRDASPQLQPSLSF
jgi:O-acetyl-ADP-ribose deacetylase (regulator of RNase III)